MRAPPPVNAAAMTPSDFIPSAPGLTIHPDLAYRDQGCGGVIPPGATLVIEVELLEVS